MPQIPKHVHVIGICGVATSALAIAFHKNGAKVTGSDKGFFPPVSTELEQQGVSFYAGWHPDKMSENGLPDLIVVGTASGSQNPETLFAKEKNIPMLSFAEAIGKYFVKDKSIVCSGTWGKTSSSALLSHILSEAGLDPTYMFGGVSLSDDSSAKLTDSSMSVFEGDEYKSSPTDPTAKFFYYKPTHLMLSAVSWDHADLYPTEAEYFNAFKKICERLPTNGVFVGCIDHAGVRETAKQSQLKCPTVFYGKATRGTHNSQKVQPVEQSRDNIIPDFTYSDVIQSPNGIEFVISEQASITHNITSQLLGAFQAENITGCFAMARQLGLSAEQIITGIASFKGLRRRLEKRLDGDVVVIDDIAHSPEKASAVLKTLRNIYKEKIITVFEPNIGGRSRESVKKYDGAFNDSDEVIIPRLTKLKVADDVTEQPIDGAELASIISKTHVRTKYIDDDNSLVDYLLVNTKKDDVIAFLGSHGFRGMIEEVVKKIK